MRYGKVQSPAAVGSKLFQEDGSLVSAPRSRSVTNWNETSNDAWVNFGRVTGGAGTAIAIEIVGGVGYNSQVAQSSKTTIIARFGNNTALPSLPNINGFYSQLGSGDFVKKVVAKSVNNTAPDTAYDLFLLCGQYPGNGYWDVKFSEGTQYSTTPSFVYSGAAGTDPGVDSNKVVSFTKLQTAQTVSAIASISDLRNVATLTAGANLFVSGYAAAGDGGEGDFVYISSATTADDNGIWIRPASVAANQPGRWKRTFNGAINPLWFGAKGDDATDNTSILQALLDKYDNIFIPRGTYRTSLPLLITRSESRLEAEPGAMILKTTNTGLTGRPTAKTASNEDVDYNNLDAILLVAAQTATLSGVGKVEIKNLKAGSLYTLPTYAIGLFVVTAHALKVERCFFTEIKHAIRSTDIWLTEILYCQVQGHRDVAFVISASPTGANNVARQGGTSVYMRGCYVGGQAGTNGSYYLQNVQYSTIHNCATDESPIFAYRAYNCKNVSIRDCGTENPKGTALFFEDCGHIQVDNFAVYGTQDLTTYTGDRALHVIARNSNVIYNNVRFWSSNNLNVAGGSDFTNSVVTKNNSVFPWEIESGRLNSSGETLIFPNNITGTAVIHKIGKLNSSDGSITGLLLGQGDLGESGTSYYAANFGVGTRSNSLGTPTIKPLYKEVGQATQGLTRDQKPELTLANNAGTYELYLKLPPWSGGFTAFFHRYQFALDFKPVASVVGTVAWNSIDNVIIQSRWRSGRWYSIAINSSAYSNVNLTANTLRVWPWFITEPITINALQTFLNTAAAGTTYRIGLYRDSGTGYPTTLIAVTDTGAIDSAGAGGVRGPTTFANTLLEPGLYWQAVNSNGAPQVRGISTTAIASIGVDPGMSSTGAIVGYTITQTYGALPATFPANAPILTNLAAPLALWRAA